MPSPSARAFFLQGAAHARLLPLTGWEQKRALPQYKPFEDELGRSIQGSEEHRCRSGLTVGRFDAEVASKGGSKSAKRLQNHTKGGFVFCCPHRVIYGFHEMLRGESPRDLSPCSTLDWIETTSPVTSSMTTRASCSRTA
jgi:hypothetical protein